MSLKDWLCEGCDVRLTLRELRSHVCEPERIRQLEAELIREAEEAEEEELSLEDRLEYGYRLLEDD